MKSYWGNRKKERVRELALDTARRVTHCEVDATVNAADDAQHESIFLAVAGTPAEGGDHGEVGRGHRACGLITPYRAMSLEAAAAKNPVSHVGKLYSLAAPRVAMAIAAEMPHVIDAECVFVSRTGRVVSDPQVVDVCLACERHVTASAVPDCVMQVVRSELGRLADLRDALLAGRVRVY